MECVNCCAETTNPKFCSKSCAAIFNNARTDVRRRQPEGACAECGVAIKVKFKYCPDHRWRDRTLNKTLNTDTGGNAGVRDMARRVYRNSGRPWSCALCGYETHVDICHIKDIRSYPHGTLYSIINDQANLIALCKNHHWEFDNGIL